MLNLRQVKHLAAHLGMSPERLNQVAETADTFCRELVLIDPAKPGRERAVLDVKGGLRIAQERLLRRVLMPRLDPSPYSHGGVTGRHVRSNVLEHAESAFVFTADISDFYPTISRNRIYKLFVKRFGCSPDVARLCTRICTFKHHLALGLITSPFLAEQVLVPVDHRIAAACQSAALTYTRYVDDVSISGGYDLQESGFETVVRQILGEHGFTIHPTKICCGRLSSGTPITKITLRNGHPDVRLEYLDELNRQIEDARSLAAGGRFKGPYYTRNQIVGRVQFAIWINPNRKRQLLRHFRSVPWSIVAKRAAELELVAAKKRLIKKQSAHVDNVGRQAVQEQAEQLGARGAP